MAIHFFNESIPFKLQQQRKLKNWLKILAKEKNHKIEQINYIFCSDEYLLALNMTYLNHNTYTDIITFDQSETINEIEADIYISIDRVRENAQTLETSFNSELFRVISHGLLHLCGYKDKTKTDKNKMRSEEESALKLLDGIMKQTVPRGTVKKD